MDQHFEKTTKGNPYGITLRQHIIPSHYIKAFAGDDGLVEVQRIVNGSRFKAAPKNQVFCVKRVWDQKAEAGWMKNIEDCFQKAVSDYLKSGKTIPNGIATDFFLLWHIKSRLARNPPKSPILAGLFPENLSKEQEEILEAKGYIYVNKEPRLKSRFVASIEGLRAMDSLRQEHAKTVWSVVISHERPFLVPKHCPQDGYLPLDPNTALFRNSHSREYTSEYTLQINKSIFEHEDEIVFSKSLRDALS
ncbi:MAG: hypothetical protein ACLPX5_08430 [Dissulfurispiraceae bacterium]